MRIKIFLPVLILTTTAAMILHAAPARFPGYTDNFELVHPQTIWDKGHRVAFFADPANPIPDGLEMPVLRGDDIIGMFYTTGTGNLNVYGYFYSHDDNIKIDKKDSIAVPLPEKLPMRHPDPNIGNIILWTSATNKIWAVVDRGLNHGLDSNSRGATLLDGRYVGHFKILFLGKKVSYGLIEREAILSLSKIDSLTIDFSRSRPETAESERKSEKVVEQTTIPEEKTEKKKAPSKNEKTSPETENKQAKPGISLREKMKDQ